MLAWDDLVLLQQGRDLPDLSPLRFRPAWHDDAACARSTANFFPERGEDSRPAKAVCAGCDVRAECLAYALAAGPMLSGVWGGTSPVERRKLRGSRRKAA